MSTTLPGSSGFFVSMEGVDSPFLSTLALLSISLEDSTGCPEWREKRREQDE